MRLPFSRAKKLSPRSLIPDRESAILGALLLLPFFEPLCFSYFDQTMALYGLAQFLEPAFILGKLATSTLAILLAARTISLRRDCLLFVSLVVICLLSLGRESFGTFLFEAGRAYSLVGLVVLLRLFFSYSPRMLLNAASILFVSLAAINFLSVYALPGGFIPERNPEGMIYFFGGKNSIFISGILAVSAVAGNDAYSKGVLTWRTWLIVTLYGITAYVVQSVSSALCFLAVGAFLFLIEKKEKIAEFLSLRNCLMIVAGLFVATVLLNVQTFFADLFSLVGKSSDFSGRGQVWEQAISKIAQHPLAGEGCAITYNLGSFGQIVTDHPHSFYLQFTACFGLLFMVPFLSDLLLVAEDASKKKKTLFTSVSVVVMFLLLLHSMYDILSLYTYLFVRGMLVFSVEETPALLPRNPISEGRWG